MQHAAVSCRIVENLKESKRLEQVTSRIEPELRNRLNQKREASLRSEAQEIKLAILAWVMDPDDEALAPAEKVAA